MVPSWADQLLPQPLMEQLNLLPMQYRHIEHYRRDFPPKFYVSILVFVFLSLQFNFVKYVIVACELPNDNSLDQRMLLKN